MRPESVLRMSFTRPDGHVVEIEISGSDYGSDEGKSKRQELLETDGDMIYVYSLGRDKLTLNLQFPQLTSEMRANLEWFLEEVEMMRRWFTIDLPAPVRKAPPRAGASVRGVALKAGQGYGCAEPVELDIVRYVVRLTSEVLFTEVCQATYSTSLALRVLAGFLPSNNC